MRERVTTVVLVINIVLRLIKSQMFIIYRKPDRWLVKIQILIFIPIINMKLREGKLHWIKFL
jgi:hypothetical protein